MARWLVGALVVGVTLVGTIQAFEVKVVDDTGNTLDVRNVRTQGQPPREYLPIETETWRYSLHFSAIADLKVDRAAKKKEEYGPTPVVVTLNSGTKIRGRLQVNLAGESEFGKAEVQHNRVESILFKKSPGDADFTPSKDLPRGTLTDHLGTSYALTGVRVGDGGNRPANEIVGTRGAVTLAIPLDEIESIDHAGEVKEQYGSKTKWVVRLHSGKSTELLIDGMLVLTGQFESGEASLPSGKLKSGAFQKKE